MIFSEVWKSFDLDENKYVACKIHHVNREWKEDKKVCDLFTLTSVFVVLLV